MEEIVDVETDRGEVVADGCLDIEFESGDSGAGRGQVLAEQCASLLDGSASSARVGDMAESVEDVDRPGDGEVESMIDAGNNSAAGAAGALLLGVDFILLEIGGGEADGGEKIGSSAVSGDEG